LVNPSRPVAGISLYINSSSYRAVNRILKLALLEAVIRNAQWKAKTAKQEDDKAERDLERMSRERLLPDEKTLEKVAH
jgi:hypothetical protein